MERDWHSLNGRGMNGDVRNDESIDKIDDSLALSGDAYLLLIQRDEVVRVSGKYPEAMLKVLFERLTLAVIEADPEEGIEEDEIL